MFILIYPLVLRSALIVELGLSSVKVVAIVRVPSLLPVYLRGVVLTTKEPDRVIVVTMSKHLLRTLLFMRARQPVRSGKSTVPKNGICVFNGPHRVESLCMELIKK